MHASCLKSSEWGEFWRKRWEWTFPKLWGQPLVWQGENVQVYLNRNTREFAVISAFGTRVNLKKGNLKGKKKWKEGLLVGRELDLYHRFSDRKMITRLEEQIDTGKEVTLLDFATVLGLEDTILYPDQLAQGRFESMRSLRRFLKGKRNHVPIVFRMYLPKEVHELIMETK